MCIQTTIVLNMSSPCLNQSNVGIDKMLAGNGLSRAITTQVIIMILLAMCLFVAAIVVPLVVYSQLVYSGFWPLLNWPQRLWSASTPAACSASTAITCRDS